MPCEAKEDGLAGHADGCEEIDGYHLESNEEHGASEYAGRQDSERNELWVMGEHLNHEVGYQFAQQEDSSHHEGGADGCEVHGSPHALVLLSSVVISHNGLHTLVQSHHNHGKDES